MALFDGTFNFSPALQGQQIAASLGSSVGQSFTSGMNAGTSRMNTDLAQQEMDFKRSQFDLQKNWLDRMMQDWGSP